MLAFSSVALRFAEGRAWWLFLLALVAAVGLVAYSYRATLRLRSAASDGGQTLRHSTIVMLLALRIVVVCILVLSIFRPVLSYETRNAPKVTLAVAVDASRSMAEFDYEGLPNRMGRAVDALVNSRGLIAELDDDFKLPLFAFADSARPVEDADGLMNEGPTGDATDLVSGVRGAVEASRAARVDLAGVILLSDGIHAPSATRGETPAATDASDPPSQIAAFGVPVHVVAVGEARLAEGTFRDIRISSVRAPSAAPVRSVARIRVMVEAQGYAGHLVQVRVFEENTEVARSDVTLDDVGGDQEVVVRLTPTEVGQHEYRAEVTTDPGENIRWNNARDFFLNVTDPRVRVLYLEGTVRPEFRFLRRSLERDHLVEPVSLIKVRTGVFRRLGESGDVDLRGFPSTREELDPFKVFIIGDLDATHFAEGQLAELAAAVKTRGKGLMLTQGAAAFGAGGYGDTPIAGLLPVRIGGRTEPVLTGKFHMELTPQGRAHPIFQGCVEYFAGPGSGVIPPFQVMNAVSPTQDAGVVVLATRAAYEDQPERPVVAIGRAGSGRAMVVTAGPTWPWSFDTSAAAKGAGAYARFWGQAIRFLAGEEENTSGPGISLRLDRGEAVYPNGSSVTIFASVRGASGELTPHAEVSAHVLASAPGAKADHVRLSPSHGRPGEYEATFTPSRSGRHTVEVNARAKAEAGGTDFGSASIKFEIESPGTEDERFDVDTKTLRAIADASGGRFVPVAQAQQLVEYLRARQSQRREAVSFAFWNAPMFFVLLVAAAGVEWFVRRRMQMA